MPCEIAYSFTGVIFICIHLHTGLSTHVTTKETSNSSEESNSSKTFFESSGVQKNPILIIILRVQGKF
jgi:hypothetical protein